METLDRRQLLGLISALVEKHPHLQPEILAHLPPLTAETYALSIGAIEKRLQDTFPYSRSGPSRTTYAYLRVKPVLHDLRDTILEGLEEIEGLEHPAEAFDFLRAASAAAARMPQWDDPSSVEGEREEVISQVGHAWSQWVSRLVRELGYGRMFGAQMVGDWGKGLVDASHQLPGDPYRPAISAFHQGLGWLLQA